MHVCVYACLCYIYSVCIHVWSVRPYAQRAHPCAHKFTRPHMYVHTCLHMHLRHTYMLVRTHEVTSLHFFNAHTPSQGKRCDIVQSCRVSVLQSIWSLSCMSTWLAYAQEHIHKQRDRITRMQRDRIICMSYLQGAPEGCCSFPSCAGPSMAPASQRVWRYHITGAMSCVG